jgi:indolepyruvate decarboxylase
MGAGSTVTAQRAAPSDPDDALSQATLWPAVAGALTAQDTVIADIGTSQLGITSQRLPDGVRFVAQSIWCSIGYALGATLGVALARPERRAVLLTGDGAAQMTIQELGTIARQQLHPIIVLVDNDGYTIEREIRGRYAPYNDITGWNWRRVAHGLTDRHDPALVLEARTNGELDEALQTARERSDRLVLIRARVDAHDVPEALAKMFAGARTAA